MPMEMIIDPAGAAADRRPPEWPAEYTADDAAGHQADRTGDKQPSPCPGGRPDHVGARAWRAKRNGGQHGRRQDECPHLSHPLIRAGGFRP